MKHIPQAAGPFRKWPFFETQEIEKIAVDDLRSCGLLPAVPSAVDIERVAKALFGFDPVYTDPGEGVMGYIRFGPKKPEAIIIHESLTDLAGGPTLEHRLRSTLAHEVGHGRLHVGPFTELFQAKKTGYANEWVRSPGTHHASFLCRASDINDAATVRGPGLAAWERMAEWQANRYMAAILAPARLVSQAVRSLLGCSDSHTRVLLTEAQRQALAPEISQCFNVSRQLASIRLGELFPNPEPQGDLFGADTERLGGTCQRPTFNLQHSTSNPC
jgi:hypothetical protein